MEKIKTDRQTLIEGITRYLNGMKDGEIITHSEKLNLIGIELPQISDYKSQQLYEADFTNAQLKIMGLWEDVRLELLRTYRRSFRSVRGDGYIMLTAKDQLDFTISDSKVEIKRIVRKGILSLNNLRTRSLTSEDMKRASDESARLSMIRSMLKDSK